MSRPATKYAVPTFKPNDMLGACKKIFEGSKLTELRMQRGEEWVELDFDCGRTLYVTASRCPVGTVDLDQA